MSGLQGYSSPAALCGRPAPLARQPFWHVVFEVGPAGCVRLERLRLRTLRENGVPVVAVMLRSALIDCGASIGLALCIGSRRWAVRVPNPFFMHLPRIYALDLRPLEVIVAEWNETHPDFPLRVWKSDVFRKSIESAYYAR